MTLTPSFSERIKWDRGAPSRDGDERTGVLAGERFTVRISSNGGKTSASWSVWVDLPSGRVGKRSAHVGGVAAARSHMRDIVRETVAIERGDAFPGNPWADRA